MAYLDSKGYVVIRINGKRVLEHRHVWAQRYGELPADFIVHHKNGIRSDNRVENLEAMTRSRHAREHESHRNGRPWNRGTAAMITIVCAACKEPFTLSLRYYKAKRRAGYRRTTCSIACRTALRRADFRARDEGGRDDG